MTQSLTGVAMVAIDFYPLVGGMQTLALELGKRLRARGLTAFAVTRRYPGLAAYEEVDGMPVYRVPTWERSKVVASLLFTVGAMGVLARRRSDYQIIHSHQLLSPSTIGLLGRELLGKRLLIQLHGGGYSGDVAILRTRRRLTGRLRLAAFRARADAFVSISAAIAHEIASMGVPARRVHAIPNGVDTVRFAPATDRTARRRALNLAAGPLVIYVGRLSPEKGVDVLLRAWPAVAARTEAHLLIVGDGKQRAALEQLVADQGMPGRATFTGLVDDARPYLQASDLLVLPSRAEGLPVALLEAMACGLPVVATAVGGSPQVLAGGAVGRLVPPDDPPALAQAILDLLADAPARTRLGAAGRQRVTEHYSFDQMCQAYLDLYRELVGQGEARCS